MEVKVEVKKDKTFCDNVVYISIVHFNSLFNTLFNSLSYSIPN